jgi:hypothetical protein
MRHIAPGIGSPGDQVNSVTVLLHQCQDLHAVEWAYPRLLQHLDYVKQRVDRVARQGGSCPGVAGPLRWLDQVLRDSPALDEPGGEPLRAELRQLVARIRERA